MIWPYNQKKQKIKIIQIHTSEEISNMRYLIEYMNNNNNNKKIYNYAINL
jgi:hypothetical protein